MGEVVEGRGVEKFNNSRVSFSASKVENLDGAYKTAGELMVNETVIKCNVYFYNKGFFFARRNEIEKASKTRGQVIFKKLQLISPPNGGLFNMLDFCFKTIHLFLRQFD